MNYFIRELRDSTGLSQTAFAKEYGIPVSTLRKWEQGEASPPRYVIDLIAKSLPSTASDLMEIRDGDSTYYYDMNRHTVADSLGNTIRVKDNLEEIHKENLPIYLGDLFSDFYKIQARFNRDCYYDRKENIIWSK